MAVLPGPLTARDLHAKAMSIASLEFLTCGETDDARIFGDWNGNPLHILPSSPLPPLSGLRQMLPLCTRDRPNPTAGAPTLRSAFLFAFMPDSQPKHPPPPQPQQGAEQTESNTTSTQQIVALPNPKARMFTTVRVRSRGKSLYLRMRHIRSYLCARVEG